MKEMENALLEVLSAKPEKLLTWTRSDPDSGVVLENTVVQGVAAIVAEGAGWEVSSRFDAFTEEWDGTFALEYRGEFTVRLGVDERFTMVRREETR